MKTKKRRTFRLIILMFLLVFGTLYFLSVYFAPLISFTYGTSSYLLQDINQELFVNHKFKVLDKSYNYQIIIDLSEYNEVIDFEKIKQENISGVILRVARRGYTEGGIYMDSKFMNYYQDAIKAKLDVGVYFFSSATNSIEAMQEAQFVYEIIKDRNIVLGVAFDQEEVDDQECRYKDLSSEQLLDNANTFLDFFKDRNYKTYHYTNLSWYNKHFKGKDLKHDLWYAQYYQEPTIDLPFKIWQFSDNANISGISGNVDINILLND